MGKIKYLETQLALVSEKQRSQNEAFKKLKENEEELDDTKKADN